MRRNSAPEFLRTRSRSMASPRCTDSSGMLAEVSISTVTASRSTRSAAQGSASAIARAANAAHFSARHTGEAPGARRIQIHRTGSSTSRSRKMGWSKVTVSTFRHLPSESSMQNYRYEIPDNIRIAKFRFLALLEFPIRWLQRVIAGRFPDLRGSLALPRGVIQPPLQPQRARSPAGRATATNPNSPVEAVLVRRLPLPRASTFNCCAGSNGALTARFVSPLGATTR